MGTHTHPKSHVLWSGDSSVWEGLSTFNFYLPKPSWVGQIYQGHLQLSPGPVAGLQVQEEGLVHVLLLLAGAVFLPQKQKGLACQNGADLE